MKQKIAFLGALMMAASCTVGPDYEQPKLFSEKEMKNALELEDKKIEDVQKNWYFIFHDERLNKLIQQALRNNQDIKIAVERLKQARYRTTIARAEYLPQFDVGGGYKYDYLANGNSKRITEDYYQVGIDALWEIDIWGSGRRLDEQYHALFLATASDLQNVKRTLTAEVASTYINAKTTQERIRILKENLRLQKDIFKTVQSKYVSGLADVSELNQAEFAVQSTKALLPLMENQLEIYQNTLEVLIGELPHNKKLLQAQNIIRNPFKFEVKNLYNYPLGVIRSRPDVKMAENMLIAQNAKIGQAVAQLYPNINVGATLGWQAGNFSDLGASNQAAYGFVPSLKLPIFNFGRLQSEVKIARSSKQEYLYIYEKALLNAVAEVRDATVGVKKAYEQYLYLKKSVENMRVVLSSVQEKYWHGLIEFSDLLTSEQNLLKAQDELSVAKGNTYIKVISFYKSVGGGYSKE